MSVSRPINDNWDPYLQLEKLVQLKNGANNINNSIVTFPNPLLTIPITSCYITSEIVDGYEELTIDHR